ncbi:putative bifunctional diguanylate cyclase/phosphodiesterase [Halomonas llamarensis]|uniref:EAL domain-containing protein n=1 Tax=Halomonas llamarensis TaxID=2945104 RepID=A0ABT0SST2_9GAMM|nr:EAL domain-containing protein [Halomonas llamarensis]MCL7930394.1 EAL domain-containing protein [Halomonas llamarensis]
MAWRDWFNLSRHMVNCSQALQNANRRLRQEIVERREAQERVASLARFPEENRQPVMRINRRGELLYTNSAARVLLNHWRCDAPSDSEPKQLCVPKAWQARIDSALTSGELVEVEYYLDHRWLLLTLTPLHDADYVNLYGTDITDRKAYEQALEQRNRYDELTGLINRHVLNDRVDQAYHTAASQNGFALVVLDLENFRLVNSLLGHQGGDEVLTALAQRLRQQVDVTATPARLDGDTFAVLLPLTTSLSRVTADVERWLSALAEPFEIDGERIECQIVAGIALGPQDGEDARALLRHAQLAAHRARQTQQRYHFFVHELNTHLHQRHQRLQALKDAIHNDRLVMFYQLQFDAYGVAVGAEALIRWPQPDGSMIPPGDFIPLAEENGLIVPIGRLALTHACAQAAKWRHSGHPLRVAVNLGAEHIHDPALPALIEELLAHYRLPASDVEIEVTESTLMHDIAQGREQLQRLRALGIEIALDDFGTGHTSLAYLRDLPAQRLKLDREFVTDLPQKPDNQAICRAVVTLGHAMGMAVLAEGVENEDEYALLKTLGVDEFQGFLLARPTPSPQVSERLKASA